YFDKENWSTVIERHGEINERAKPKEHGLRRIGGDFQVVTKDLVEGSWQLLLNLDSFLQKISIL
ncbi:unnamed protein product, partial [Ceratitis capitata]